ncbi:MAG TPA: DUF1844 domain-containing protein [Methylomirabilota bacterium]|nr:DUF1844 domain-containing protein [Methylomirabilota bacterium]
MADEQPFRVTDRRRRDDAAPEAPAPPVQPDLGAPIQSPPAPSPGSPPSPDAPAGGPDLQGLFVMLASSALVNLGEAADPATGERMMDLEQARDAVDLLVMLRTKTEGNRTPQESHLLEEILYDLQVRFVRAAKGAHGH